MSIFSWIRDVLSDGASNRKLYGEGKANRSVVRGLDPQRGMSEKELEEYAKKSDQEKNGWRKRPRRD